MILLSSIGNRNIQYKGEFLDVRSFRTLTKVYLQEFDTHKEHLSLSIIQTHIDETVKAIYLITTNQADEYFRDKDTLYEGEIMKKLISSEYEIPVHLMEFNGNPSDENEFMAFFAHKMKELLNTYPEEEFVFNDAGGTPQMKQGIKEVMEYYLPASNFVIKYASPLDEKRVIERYYSKLFTILKIVEHFVLQYNYSAALEVMERIDDHIQIGKLRQLKTWLRLGNFRVNIDFGGIKDYSNGKLKNTAGKPLKIEKNISSLPFMKQFISPNALGENIVPVTSIKAERRWEIFEIASLAQLYLSREDYTIGSAHYIRLIEDLFSAYIRYKTKSKLDKQSDLRRLFENYLSELQGIYPELKGTPGLPFYIALSEHLGD
ncbi:MAG: hypothetical protein AAFR66_18825, partial [Bacteroidota bacterium]